MQFKLKKTSLILMIKDHSPKLYSLIEETSKSLKILKERGENDNSKVNSIILDSSVQQIVKVFLKTLSKLGGAELRNKIINEVNMNIGEVVIKPFDVKKDES